MRAPLCLILVLALSPLAGMDAGNVLIVANENAEGSEEIAQYYADLRGVPASQIVKIKASENEEISRAEFNSDIWKPVSEYVLAHDNILAIVPTRGVPLKIKQEAQGKKEAFKGRDFASVDGELALIRYGEYDIDGVVENPILDSKERITFESKVLVVSRLDGPTVEIAKGLVEKAILAEALGCSGESFLDTRGLTGGDGYQQRDDIMEQVETAWKTAELPYVHDTDNAVFDVSDRPETLHYYGWYAGNPGKWKNEVKFRTGGICIHLHSFSGATVRDIKRNWVAPLLNWNATCCYGTTYEPYTTGFPYEHILWDRLCNGWSFGEAGQVANHLLSWQAVFCGDPLYTPYAEDYAETHKRYRAALIGKLVPADGVVVDAEGLPLLDACERLLLARADKLKQLTRTDAGAALFEFNDIRFLVRDMELDAWLAELSEPFEKELERQLKVIEARVKDDMTDTTELEAALDDWKGLPIHEKLVELRNELAEDQEDDASKLVRKAEAYAKSERWLKAYMYAAEAAALRFAESSARAEEIVKEIAGNKEAVAEMAEETDKDLKPLVERAQKEFDKGKFDRAAKYLGREWRFYPDSEQRKAAEALDRKIREELAKEK